MNRCLQSSFNILRFCIQINGFLRLNIDSQRMKKKGIKSKSQTTFTFSHTHVHFVLKNLFGVRTMMFMKFYNIIKIHWNYKNSIDDELNIFLSKLTLRDGIFYEKNMKGKYADLLVFGQNFLLFSPLSSVSISKQIIFSLERLVFIEISEVNIPSSI